MIVWESKHTMSLLISRMHICFKISKKEALFHENKPKLSATRDVKDKQITIISTHVYPFSVKSSCSKQPAFISWWYCTIQWVTRSGMLGASGKVFIKLKSKCWPALLTSESLLSSSFIFWHDPAPEPCFFAVCGHAGALTSQRSTIVAMEPSQGRRNPPCLTVACFAFPFHPVPFQAFSKSGQF